MLMRVLVLTLATVCLGYAGTLDSPKLVVGIVVDQMRQEYLYRYQSKFGDKGFRLLLQEGFSLSNAHCNYMPTETAPGHASIFTASSPSVHGIIGNYWWDRKTQQTVSCVDSKLYRTVGGAEGVGAGPDKLLSTTITDELKISSQQKAKVFGISIKDRGAILPAGHMPDGAYWFDGDSGNFVTSTYYQDALPAWLTAFNQQGLAKKMSEQIWQTLLPLEQYTESGRDESPYERMYPGETSTAFPHDLAVITAAKGDFGPLEATAFGNDLLLELSKALLENEKLGTGESCDFLTISFSSTDRLGHQAEPNSVEVEDMYLRLDRTVAELIQFLDARVGRDSYVLFLTADHGAAENRQYLADHRIPGGLIQPKDLQQSLTQHLKQLYPGKEIIEAVSSEQVYLREDIGSERSIYEQAIVEYLRSFTGIAQVYTQAELRQIPLDEKSIRGNVIRGYYPNRSGDIFYVMQPQWVAYPPTTTGTGHGSPYPYDTHVPALFLGKNIPAGSSSEYHRIQDIAATLAVLIGTKYPSGCIGEPIVSITDAKKQ